jgi:excisionase family DNA binding protein
MDEKISFETLIKELLTPIIEQAVDHALARHLPQHNESQRQQSLPELLDVKMTAEFLHLSVPTIYGLIHKREIPFYKRSGRLLFRRDDLDKWIAGGRRMTVDEIKEAAAQSLVRGRRR